MEASIKNALMLIKSKGEIPLIGTYVEDSSGFWNKKRIIVVSDCRLSIMSIKGDSIVESHQWVKLSYISLAGNRIVLKFGKAECNLEISDLPKVAGEISFLLGRILTRKELISLEMNGFKLFNTKPNPLSIISRFCERCRTDNIQIESKIVDHLKHILVSSLPIVSLDSFQRASAICSPFLDSLPLMNTIGSVKVSQLIDKDIYLELVPLVSQPTALCHIHIQAEVTKNFSSFATAFLQNKDSKIYGLTFSSSNFSASDLKQISSMINEKKISCLGFREALSPEGLSYFHTSFLQASNIRTLRYLDLSKTTKLNLSTLMAKLRNLTILNLESCGLDISQIFAVMSSSQLPHLKILNIGGNQFLNKIDSIHSPPPNLTSLWANSISFSDGMLVHFASYLFNSFAKGLRLSMSNTLASTDEWFRLFTFLQTTSYTGIKSLKWDSNPTYASFFEFLSKNKEIDTLSLCGCFYESNQIPIGCLADFLESVPNIENLFLRGNKTSYFGQFTVAILSAMQGLSKLKYLDISSNRGGDNTVLGLKLLVGQLAELNTISFDGTKPSSSQPLFDLFAVIKHSGRKVSVSYPENDISHLKKGSSISEEQIDWLKNELIVPLPKQPAKKSKAKPQIVPEQSSPVDKTTTKKNTQLNPDADIDLIRPTSSPFDVPTQLYYSFIPSSFPEFFKPEDLAHQSQQQVAEGEDALDNAIQPNPNNDNESQVSANQNNEIQIASLNFGSLKKRKSQNSKENDIIIPLPVVPSAPVSENRIQNRTKELASTLRKITSQKHSQKDSFIAEENVSISSPKSVSSKKSKKSITIRSVTSKRSNATSVISPYHQELTLTNYDHHSWQFPDSFDISLNDEVWKQLQNEYNIQSLYDTIKNDKPIVKLLPEDSKLLQ